MPLQQDIAERIRRDFSAEESEVAIQVLTEARLGGHISRCVVFSAQGSFAQLRAAIDVAKKDFRDAILAAEYDFPDRLRNFTVSFLLEEPRHMWANWIAGVAVGRGYTLVSIETRPTTERQRGPFELYPFEGIARFTGPIGEVVVENRGGQWFLHDIGGDLDRYNLNRSFGNESEFADAVSSYLLIAKPRGRKPP